MDKKLPLVVKSNDEPDSKNEDAKSLCAFELFPELSFDVAQHQNWKSIYLIKLLKKLSAPFACKMPNVIVVCGYSSEGKSSLINTLMNDSSTNWVDIADTSVDSRAIMEECRSRYEELMEKSMSTSNSTEELEKCHETMKQRILEECARKNPHLFNNPGNYFGMATQLMETINSVFKKIKRHFEISIRREANSVRASDLADEAVVLYENRMRDFSLSNHNYTVADAVQAHDHISKEVTALSTKAAKVEEVGHLLLMLNKRLERRRPSVLGNKQSGLQIKSDAFLFYDGKGNAKTQIRNKTQKNAGCQTELSDFVKMSVEICNGKFSFVVPENSKVPCTFTGKCWVSEEKQRHINYSLSHGKQSNNSVNELVGKFVVDENIAKKAVQQEGKATMTLDEAGVLQVEASAYTSGGSGSIMVMAKREFKSIQE